MASVTETKLIDDITGDPADETVNFGLDGTQFEIDLSSNQAGVLRDILSDYVEHGRRTGKFGAAKATARRASVSASPTTARAGREQIQAVREWARAHGHTVSDRGRLPVKVQAEFDAAHRGSQLSAVG